MYDSLVVLQSQQEHTEGVFVAHTPKPVPVLLRICDNLQLVFA